MYKFLPEAKYEYNSLTMADVKSAYENGTTITGYVKYIFPAKEEIKVKLGDDLYATLPFTEVTMYPWHYSRKNHSALPSNIRCLRNKKIRIKVTSIQEENILVSRKKNMEEAFELIKDCKYASLYITEVIPKSAFGDIGEGLVGKIFVNEISTAHIHHVKELLSHYQTIDTIILGIDEDRRINLSYKQTFRPFNKEDYSVGMTIPCRVCDPKGVNGYYVYVSPQVSGIMVAEYYNQLDYGTNVEAVVTAIGNSGLFLKFSKIV